MLCLEIPEGAIQGVLRGPRLYKAWHIGVGKAGFNSGTGCFEAGHDTFDGFVVAGIGHAFAAAPAAVVFDALQAARARGADVLIADTAGRLHTQSHLMDELAKIARVMKRQDAAAPHEVLLVLDAGLGQNAVRQAEQFSESIGVTGIAVTKLDGTAKGGVVIAIARRFGIPIRYVGVGEQAEDFGIFNARAYVEGLLRPAAAGKP